MRTRTRNDILGLLAAVALAATLGACALDAGDQDDLVIDEEIPPEEALDDPAGAQEAAIADLDEVRGIEDVGEVREDPQHGACPAGYHHHHVTWGYAGLYSFGTCSNSYAGYTSGVSVCAADGPPAYSCNGNGYVFVYSQTYWWLNGYMRMCALDGHC